MVKRSKCIFIKMSKYDLLHPFVRVVTEIFTCFIVVADPRDAPGVLPPPHAVFLGHLYVGTPSWRVGAPLLRGILDPPLYCTLVFFFCLLPMLFHVCCYDLPVQCLNVWKYFYRPKRSFGQGNIFRSVCHSVHRGGVCSKFWGGLSAPNFRGGVCSKFSGGGWGVCSKFSGVEGRGVCSKFSGGSLSAPNFRGGVCSKFLGGSAHNFGGGVSNFRNTVNVRPVRILLECILVFH